MDVMVNPGNIHDSVAFDELYKRLTGKHPEIKNVVMDAGYKVPCICKKVIDYIIDPEKTDDQRLCSTYECTLQCATMDFEDVRLQGTGRTTVLAEHIL